MIKVCASKEPSIPVNALLIAINDQRIDDILEYRFYNDQSKTRRVLIEHEGHKTEVIFEPDKAISIQLEDPVYKECENNCDFCFINGLPPGLRKELYFRDDDYRLSFMFGHFLSLTNIDKKDIQRIARLRLSPLYVSVHTTDPELRKKLFQHEKARFIMEQLCSLTDHDIEIHCQVVVIPGVNDGANLIKTITDLGALYPGIASIGIVPIGKTRHTNEIPSVSQNQAKIIIHATQELHNTYRKKYKQGLVYLADEFFIKANMPIPETKYYDDFPQYENGIGITRTFLSEIDKLNLKRKIHGRYLFLTGFLAFSFVNELKAKLQTLGCIDENLIVAAVPNSFLGRSVTVSGLLGARDFTEALSRINGKYDRIMLPPNCVNDSKQFIDNQTLNDPRIIIAPKSLKELLTWLQ
jgi:putative radical SAM enzyme (TIGR03279 family)